MDSGLEIRLLGGVRFTLNGTPVTGFTSHKVAALLAYLAVERRPHSRETLAALLWGGLPDADARNNLRQTLTYLRKLVGTYLHIDREHVAFQASGACLIDVEAFLQCLKHDGKRTTDTIEHWQAADAFYVGDFMAGFVVRDAPEYEEWLLAQRARYRELALHALYALTEQLTAQGEHARAVESATRLLALDPWREETHRQLMRLKARTGQRSAAMAQYEVCRQVLEKELGVEPAVETTALYERLKAAQRRPRHNLPGSLTGFVGREAEFALLMRRFADPACRLVTLTGPGGIGKTRLALRVAEALSETLINGAWFVSLSDASPADLIEHLADAIGLPLRAGNVRQQLLNALRTRELLLVLDNFEHLVESAGLLSDIQLAAPDVKILVTSRERLDLKSEWVYPLDGLALPTDAQQTDPARYAAGQLFLLIAEHHQPATPPTSDEAQAILEICRLLGGLPLGIELAAARAQVLTCVTTAAEIRRGSAELATRQRDIPERQRSLRAVVESSVAALSPVERRLFEGLSVFPHGFSAAAAFGVVGATATQLTSLVDKSLVREIGGRYDLHEVLQRFAAEALARQPDLHAELQGRHSHYFAMWLRAITEQAATPGDESAWMTAVAEDFANLRSAWAWASAERHGSDLSLLLEGVFRFMNVRGHYREGVDWFSSASERLAPDPQATDERGRLAMRLSVARARFLLELGQAEAAVPLFETGRLYFERVSEPRPLARCLNGLGTAARAMGQFERARGYCSAQLEVARIHELRDEIASALNNLGVVVSDMSDYAEAIRLHRECLALRRELGDRVGIASSLINLATALVDLGDDTQTAELLGEALAISREFNDARRIGAVLTNLGAAARRAGKLQEERVYYRQALAVHRESGHRLGIALALNNLGSVAARLNDADEARRSLRAALAESQESHFDFVMLDALVWLALLTARAGDALTAVEWLAHPLKHPAADGETVVAAQTLLSEISQGHSATAIANALERGRAHELHDRVRAFLETV